MSGKTIEQRAIKEYGLTEHISSCGYILQDGSMLNFSEGYGLRTIDHASISNFFNYDQSEFGVIHKQIIKFLKRGNMRVITNNEEIGIEFAKPPTREQKKALERIANYDKRRFLFEKHVNGKRVYIGDYFDFSLQF